MREETVSFDEAISGYFTRLPRSLWLLARHCCVDTKSSLRGAKRRGNPGNN
ncbi:hypothetical protein [Rickettsia hoogstraalii]|uniref:hypothetical protein n=1 Tax=Rickettsia hoogstraalii TaxID=467174 RepID=UPI000A8C8771|nr:hypothetical protein [Rickettsia hoogstraalii]